MSGISAQLVREVITLGTPRGRLVFYAVASAVVFVVPLEWLAHLSLWPRVGWKTAPSIGLTRSYHLLLHGHPVAAWRQNWLMYAVLAVWLVIMGKDVWSLYRARKARKAKSA